jgi:hypothetical protein
MWVVPGLVRLWVALLWERDGSGYLKQKNFERNDEGTKKRMMDNTRKQIALALWVLNHFNCCKLVFSVIRKLNPNSSVSQMYTSINPNQNLSEVHRLSHSQCYEGFLKRKKFGILLIRGSLVFLLTVWIILPVLGTNWNFHCPLQNSHHMKN